MVFNFLIWQFKSVRKELYYIATDTSQNYSYISRFASTLRISFLATDFLFRSIQPGQNSAAPNCTTEVLLTRFARLWNFGLPIESKINLKNAITTFGNGKLILMLNTAECSFFPFLRCCDCKLQSIFIRSIEISPQVNIMGHETRNVLISELQHLKCNCTLLAELSYGEV